jgi:hypothetical protein
MRVSRWAPPPFLNKGCRHPFPVHSAGDEFAEITECVVRRVHAPLDRVLKSSDVFDRCLATVDEDARRHGRGFVCLAVLMVAEAMMSAIPIASHADRESSVSSPRLRNVSSTAGTGPHWGCPDHHTEVRRKVSHQTTFRDGIADMTCQCNWGKVTFAGSSMRSPVTDRGPRYPLQRLTLTACRAHRRGGPRC